MDAKFNAWYTAQSRKGDPTRIPNLIEKAFAAGRIAERESELAQIVRDSAKTEGEVVVTTNESGQCVAVTRQDSEGRILSSIWQLKSDYRPVEFSAVPVVDLAHWRREVVDPGRWNSPLPTANFAVAPIPFFNPANSK